MIVTINSATVTLNGHPTLERNVKEELDTGKISIVSTKAFRYEMYDKVDITDPFGNVEQYLIQADNVVKINATEYEHDITLFENIGFFNTIYPADRSFKVVGQTLEDILTAYKRELSSYHLIDITWTTIPQATLDELIPFKEFSGLNLSSILLSLFRKIWAVPKVNRIVNDWDIYAFYYNERNNSIDSDAISEISQQNNVDYATKVKTQLKNAVNERTADEVTWFPSESGYVLPRSSSLEKITSKLRYELDSDIITMLKVEAVGVGFDIQNVTSGLTETYSNQAIDITAYVVQEEVWDYLATQITNDPSILSQTNNSKNHVRYKALDKYVTNLFESSTEQLIFKIDTPYLLNAILRGIYVYYNTLDNYIAPVLNFPTATDEVRMRFKYVKQRNIDMIYSRKTKGVMNESTTIHQQRDASVEINEYKKNLKIYANRMGNNEFSKTKVFTYPDEPYELFDYTDDKTIVTRVQNTYHSEYVYCEYEESVDFSNIEAEYALMRRSDPYTISAKAVTTNLVIQESLEFSTQERTLATRLEDNARRLLLGLFEATTIGIDKVAVGVFKPVLTSWNDDYSIHMPVEASGDGNLITLHVQFPHQTIAGKTYYDLDTDTYEDYLNPLPYTDSEGTLEDYQLYFTPDILFEDSGQYPIILDETLYLASALTTTDVNEPIDLDTAASFAVTFEVNITADENIHIGNALAINNYFIKDQDTTTAIAIYSSTKPYGQYNQVPRTTDTDVTASVSYTYSFANRTITITPAIDIDYFSIVKDGDILLAVNRAISAGETLVIYINHINSNVIAFKFEAMLSATSSTSITLLQAINYLFNATFTATSSTSMASQIGKFNYAVAIDMSATSSTSIASQIGKFNLATALDVSAISSTGIAYLQALNIVIALEVAEATSSTDISYVQGLNKLLIGSVNGVGTVKLRYGYYPNYDAQIELSATSSTDITYVQAIDRYLTVELSATSSVDESHTASLNPSPVEWVEVSSGTPTGGDCIILADEGNIKSTLVYTCSYDQDGSSYTSGTDLTETPPTCGDGVTYTVCFFSGGTYYCQDYIGVLESSTQLYECQLK